MKELHGSASAIVAAPVRQCLTLLRDLERYPSWYPEVVREAEVLERDDRGEPVRVSTTLHISAGPLVRDLPLLLAIVLEQPATVKLTRIAYDSSDEERLQVIWRVEQHDETELHLELEATLAVPRLVPLGGLGDSIAAGFLAAAARALGRPVA